MNAAPQDYTLPDLDDVPGREPYCTRPGCGLPVDPHRGPAGTLTHDATYGVWVPGHPVELAWRDRVCPCGKPITHTEFCYGEGPQA